MFSRRVSAYLFSAFLLAGVVAISSTAVSAQWSNGQYQTSDGYPNWGGSYELRQGGLNSGYSDGQKAGARDLSNGQRSNFNDFNEYRSATNGYNSRYGDRSLFQRYYRIGFERAYSEAFGNRGGGWNNNNNNNGGWNNNGGTWNNGNRTRRGRSWGQYGSYGGSANFRQTALNAGYNEGIKQGRKDRSRGPRNLSDFSSYRNANTDYKSQNGDLGLHQRYYREGFENGYYDGLNGY